MKTINLQQVPNQNFKFRAGEELYDITIRTTQYGTYISISRNDVVLISNQILTPNAPILAYEHLVTNGNFVLETEGNNAPDYTRFGNTQNFYYFEISEIKEALNA